VVKKLEEEEELGATIRFIEQYIGKYYKTAIGRFFIKD